MKLIVGLGNPGVEYAWTRHNSGWLMLDGFVSRLSLSAPQNKFRGDFWGPVLHKGERIALLKPHTYMNLSGLSVIEAVNYQNLTPKDVLVIYDDVSLPFGRLRMREKGSAGGQNGMKSIIAALDTLEIPRIRIGIGMPEHDKNLAEWVLSTIPKKQCKIWDKLTDAAWEAVEMWIQEDIQKAMNNINSISLETEQCE